MPFPSRHNKFFWKLSNLKGTICYLVAKWNTGNSMKTKTIWRLPTKPSITFYFGFDFDLISWNKNTWRKINSMYPNIRFIFYQRRCNQAILFVLFVFLFVCFQINILNICFSIVQFRRNELNLSWIMTRIMANRSEIERSKEKKSSAHIWKELRKFVTCVAATLGAYTNAIVLIDETTAIQIDGWDCPSTLINRWVIVTLTTVKMLIELVVASPRMNPFINCWILNINGVITFLLKRWSGWSG